MHNMCIPTLGLIDFDAYVRVVHKSLLITHTYAVQCTLLNENRLIHSRYNISRPSL